MVFDFFRRTGPSTVENVEAMLVEMMRDAKTVFDASTAAVFGGGKSKETRREVKSTDRGINRAQQEVRRALMVHATVHDPVDLPQVLTYMSVVKDVERVGDYAKNLYDLAKYGVDFEAAADGEELLAYLKRDVPDLLILDISMPGVNGLEAHQFTATRHNHLAHLLQTALELGEDLFGIAVGPFLDGGCLLAATADEGLTLLLRLLAELECIALHPLCLRLAALLHPHRLMANLLQFRQALLASLLMLLGQLALEF